jgi:hypothetical protein
VDNVNHRMMWLREDEEAEMRLVPRCLRSRLDGCCRRNLDGRQQAQRRRRQPCLSQPGLKQRYDFGRKRAAKSWLEVEVDLSRHSGWTKRPSVLRDKARWATDCRAFRNSDVGM